jgi:hypothetical protein
LRLQSAVWAQLSELFPSIGGAIGRDVRFLTKFAISFAYIAANKPKTGFLSPAAHQSIEEDQPKGCNCNRAEKWIANGPTRLALLVSTSSLCFIAVVSTALAI